MAVRVIEWDREKLYDQVWTRPLRTVAHEHGLSDVALVKVCKKLQIPRPGVGYWRRKECGFKVERVPLPPAKEIVTVVSHLSDFQEKKPRRLSEELIPLRKVMEAPKALRSVIKQTERAFADAHPDQFGRVQADWRLPHLDIRVTRVGMARALKFMDMLVRLLEANNMTVTPGTGREPAVIRVEWRFRAEGEQFSERSDAGISIVQEVFGFVKKNYPERSVGTAPQAEKGARGKGRQSFSPPQQCRNGGEHQLDGCVPPRFLRMESPRISMRWAL